MKSRMTDEQINEMVRGMESYITSLSVAVEKIKRHRYPLVEKDYMTEKVYKLKRDINEIY